MKNLLNFEQFNEGLLTTLGIIFISGFVLFTILRSLAKKYPETANKAAFMLFLTQLKTWNRDIELKEVEGGVYKFHFNLYSFILDLNEKKLTQINVKGNTKVDIILDDEAVEKIKNALKI